MQIIIGESWWWVPLIFLAAFVIAYWMYFGPQLTTKKDWKFPSFLLVLLRTLSIAGILFLLLGPFLKFNETQKVKPSLHVLVDHSQSMNLDTSASQDYTKLRNKLAEVFPNFDIRYTNLEGGSVNDSLNFDQSSTNLMNALGKLSQQLKDQSKAAILWSDGIFNEGANPSYYPLVMPTNLYVLGHGDTAQKKDLWVEQVKTNEFVLLGNEFPVRVSAFAYGFAGKEASYTIKTNGQIQKSGTLKLDQNNYYWQQQFMLKAFTPGVQRVEVSLSPLDQEQNTLNNRFEVFLNVLDNRKKICILYHGAHPDVAAVQRLLGVQKNYEVKISRDVNEALKSDIIIAVQWPSVKQNNADPALARSLKPVFVIGGELQNWNYWQEVIGNVGIQSARPNLSTAVLNKNFSAFQLDDAEEAIMKDLPPLHCPFGKYPSGLKVLAYQKINGVESEYPLWALSNKKKRTAILFGEGIWKWRIEEFRTNKNAKVSELLMDKSIQWLLSGKDKPLFSVKSSKTQYFASEDVRLKAELYNSIFEPILNEKIEIEILGDTLRKKTVMNTAGTYYETNLGPLPAGSYTVLASAKGQKAQTGFTVMSVSEEMRRTRANWSLLSGLADRFKGSFYAQKDMELLLNELKSTLDDTVVIKQKEQVKPLIQWPYFLALITFLLGVEWIIRKYYGRL